ncbi:FAD-dependent thymidylate synthase [Kitasatospora sp. NPDC059463]|uniref:FAD-dependent thymidylate synthase n=1 Tax=unclassified Kitasatospora TaxID=2633591 RepID=UPI0036B6C9D9
MKLVEPEITVIARPSLDLREVTAYLREIGGEQWLARFDQGALDNPPNDAETLAEIAGRMCYRSWEPGLNPNVTRVRTDQAAYLRNVLASAHGSVLEHANFTFVLKNVSRVLTHELVRHRAGTAVSQESLRFLRLDELPFWFPDWAKDDPELMERTGRALRELEELQLWMARHFGLDREGVPFAEKKHRTSFMRRFAPEGVGTSLVWTANVRTLRHVIESRTAPEAEEEIRLVFHRVGELMRAEAPTLFGDYEVTDGSWTPAWRKV